MMEATGALMPRRAIALSLFMFMLAACAAPNAAGRVTVERVRDGGLQPQAITDSRGVTHVVYLKGNPDAADVYYVRRAANGTYSKPVRVNDRPHSAVAIASVRGAQLALGSDGRVHVVWNGAAMSHGGKSLPLWYSRQNDARDGFEPQRDLVTWAVGLDGGATVAADPGGRVFVAWRGDPTSSRDADGGVYLTQSADDGRTFTRERRVDTGNKGACACCSMRAAVDAGGALYLLYRAATNDVDRDTVLLSSADGETFSSAVIDRWHLDACPLSTSFLTPGPRGLIAAWETQAQVMFGQVAAGGVVSRTVAPGRGRRKHPVLTYSRDGEALFAWVENSAWARGGSVAWQLYDKDGRPTPDHGVEPGVPAWSLAAATALNDGRFLLLY